MKQNILIWCFLLIGFSVFSQEENTKTFTIDANYFYGNILLHSKDIAHLITEHPEGFIVSYNKKTFGDLRWQQEYNYPDWGFSTFFQNSKNNTLGNNIGVYAHLNFYFIQRNLQLRVAQGVAYNSNPFDFESNIKNNAYGSHILFSTYLLLNYSKENIYKNIGVQAGITFMHYSNGNVAAPNTSTNTLAFNIGVNYKFNDDSQNEFINDTTYTRIKEPIKFNAVIRGGINESDYLNLGQQPFLVISAFVDKRLSYKSTVTAGVDVFFSKFLEKEIEYVAASFPSFGVSGDEDYKRVGLFVGHDLHINRFSALFHLGYYVYYPYDFEGRFYQRIGLKYFITDNIFGVISLKTHAAKAEAVEFSVGYRF